MFLRVFIVAALVARSGVGLLEPQKILWRDAEHHQAAFVPESMLQQGADAPMVQEAFRQIGELQLNEQHPCMLPIESDIDAESAGTTQYQPLPQWLERFEIAVVARVVSITSGWDLEQRRVASLVSFEPVAVLRDTRAIVGDDTWTYLQGWGTVRTAIRTVCAKPLGETVSVDDVIFLAGAADRYNDHYLLVCNECVFRIENDAVVVPPALRLPGPSRVPLDDLRTRSSTEN